MSMLRKLIILLLAIVLTSGVGITLTGCKKKETPEKSTEKSSLTERQKQTEEAEDW